MNSRIFQIKPILDLIAVGGFTLTLCDRSLSADLDVTRAIPTQVTLDNCRQVRACVVDQEKAVKISGGSISSGEHLAYVVAADWPSELKPSHQVVFEGSTFQIEEQQRIRDSYSEILIFIKLNIDNIYIDLF